MVRIYQRVAKRRYFGGKGFYIYQSVSLPIPRRLHEQLWPYIGRDLDIDMAIDAPAQKITITLKVRA